MDIYETKPYRSTRKMAVAEAALEYLINILVTGAFLARITTNLGFSDSLTGILSSIASLGCLFQLFSVFIRPKRIKPVVIGCTVVSEFLFLFLYVIPLTSMSPAAKTAVFVASLSVAYLAMKIIFAKKMNWFMSMVDNRKWGTFTANKEIISLAAGIVFSFAMGRIIDSRQTAGDLKSAFAICAAVILVLFILQLLTLIFSAEEEKGSGGGDIRMSSGLKQVLSDKTVLSLTVFLVIFRIGTFTSSTFYGTYQIKELGFSQTLVVTMTATGAVVRMIFSRFMGRYADRHSFAKMDRICLVFLMMAYLMASFAAPTNGKLFFTLYYVLEGISMAGANSAITNLIFDYVPPEKRTDALAVSQAASGLSGFLAALVSGRLVAAIQENGNRFLGLNVYAQQVTSFIAAIIMGICIIYITKLMDKLETVR